MSKKPYYLFFPSPIQEEPKDPSKILSDLGRATKRGIRKCFKCGTYNGTRGLMCKNKQCDAVFKDCGEKQKANLDAIKLVSGTSRQVFSVRVRDKGPDCRGFVQLPLMQGTNQVNEKNVALSEVALCFVDSCQRLFDDSILKCHETDQNKVMPICIHIKSALKSVNVAVPIETKSCILNSLNFEEDIKNKLWSLSSETEGALVQRVSKTVMAVKCQVTPKHPLGYLHFTFCVTKARETYDKFYCSCLNFKGRSCLNDNLAVLNQKCIHFYACVWAFASDLKFTEEFIDFLNLVLCTGNDFQTIRGNASLKKEKLSSHCFNSITSNLKKCKSLKKKTSTLNMIHISRTELNIKQKVHRKLATKLSIQELKQQNNRIVAEEPTSLSFIDWLASITEKVNQSLIRRQRDCTETLSFYAPLRFYHLLEDRLRNNGKQLNHTTNGTKGVSYLIYSISQLKEIFDTPQVPLHVVEIFLQNNQEDVIVNQQQDSMCQSQVEYKQVVIFLKIGIAKNENSCIPFTITWTPNALPISNFGKLELTFHIGCCDAALFNTFS